MLQKIEAATRNGSYSVGDIEANSVILKIGEAVSDKGEEVTVIPLFGEENEDHLVEFLAGLGR